MNSKKKRDFTIKGRLDFLSDNSVIDITNMFNNRVECEEMGIMRQDRILIAHTNNGYKQLIDMGFSHKEIMKYYGNSQED